jgi:hypothetical protein
MEPTRLGKPTAPDCGRRPAQQRRSQGFNALTCRLTSILVGADGPLAMTGRDQGVNARWATVTAEWGFASEQESAARRAPSS